MAGKRKVHTAAFKAQVALAALKRDRTINELAGHYGVHPTLIHGWKKQLLTGAEGIFGNPAKAASADAEARQCELLGLSRSSLYYEPGGEAAEDLRLMRRIDEQYTACPFYGSRRMTAWLVQQGEVVNRKRVQRLMRLMGLEAIYPKPRLSGPGRGHRIYPYWLRDVR